MDPQTRQLMREYRRRERGRYRTPADYLPKRTPVTTLQLLAMAAHAGKHVGALCSAIHRDKGEWGVKGILGVRALMRHHGVVADALPRLKCYRARRQSNAARYSAPPGDWNSHGVRVIDGIRRGD